MITQKDILIQKLNAIGVIQYGNYILKSGKTSNVYCDFRQLLSYPNYYEQIYDVIPEEIFDDIDLVCGVYFGGLPFSNFISVKRNIPQIFIRETKKEYGTNKIIEGNYEKGDNVLLIEDVITTGGSVIDKVNKLIDHGLKVKVLTILDRSDGLSDNFDFKVKSIFNINDILNNQLNDKLYKLVFEKKSNIIFSVDLENSVDIISKIELIKDNIIGIKIHSDIIKDFHILKEYLLNKKVNGKFLREELVIIEDCKLADISFISLKKIKEFETYADYITYHCLLGENLPLSLKENSKLGLLGIIEMSIEGCLIDNIYIQKSLKQVKNMDGCVIQNAGLKLLQENKIKIPTFSPGISLNIKNDNYNQTYTNPKDTDNLIGDFWIIGRNLYESSNIVNDSLILKNLSFQKFLHKSI